MRLILGRAGDEREIACFFCGQEYTFQRGDEICCVELEDNSASEELDHHVCSSCAGLEDGRLRRRFQSHVNEYRNRAQNHRDKARCLEEMAEGLERLDMSRIDRVWHVSLIS